MPRASFLTNYGCDPSSEHLLSLSALAAPSFAQVALQNSLLLVSYRKPFGVMSPSLSFTLWSCNAAKRHLLDLFVFVICFLCGWRGLASVVNMLHSGTAVRPCYTILLSHGRPCLIYHRGTILASTGCAHRFYVHAGRVPRGHCND